MRGNRTSGEIFEEIRLLLCQLAEQDLTVVPAESMAGDQITLRQIESSVQAESLRRLRRFDKGQGFANTLALSAKAWLRWKCRLSGAEASDRVEVARQLESLELTTRPWPKARSATATPP